MIFHVFYICQTEEEEVCFARNNVWKPEVINCPVCDRKLKNVIRVGLLASVCPSLCLSCFFMTLASSAMKCVRKYFSSGGERWTANCDGSLSITSFPLQLVIISFLNSVYLFIVVFTIGTGLERRLILI